ncbi:TrmH family RNA methyltransferase [Enterococcus timonensis]|uniref:TrmH family RNA methyltransferase n=1 Tax=Enterococcus timonensis TaxID=1852364 RepID=UPI0008D9DFC2|nr:RNA methyltransferase [Enterococcus timonensis]
MITAKDNPKIKQLKKLHLRKNRTKFQQYIIEGFHLVEEAHFAQAKIEEIYVTEDFLQIAPAWLSDYSVQIVAENILQLASQLPTTPGIIALVKKNPPATIATLSGGFLLLDRIQDPGNLGTMIRSADAFGLSGVVLGSGTVDLYDQKVLRALQGSLYHLPIFEGDLNTWIQKAQGQNIPVYGTELNEQAIPLRKVVPTENFLVILGNEGQGVDEALLKQTNENIYIEMNGQAESLNVGVACGIVLYHLCQKF